MNENEATIQSYEDNSEDYINSRSHDDHIKFNQWIVDALADYDKTVNIFEIGSGPGFTADYLESKGLKVMRSDIVDKFIDFNKKRGKVAIKHDVINDKIPGKFEAVLAINVMQHMNHIDMEKSLKHIYDGLQENGLFLFTIVLGSPEEWHEDSGGARYFSAWSEAELKNALVQSGFGVESIEPINYKNWFNVIAKRK